MGILIIPDDFVSSQQLSSVGFPRYLSSDALSASEIFSLYFVIHDKIHVSVQDETLWLVPLSFCKESKVTEECFSTVLEGHRAKITIPDVAPNEWVKLNPGTIGFYRTKYPPEMLQAFVPSVEQKLLPPLDRLGLLDDLFALVCHVT